VKKCKAWAATRIGDESGKCKACKAGGLCSKHRRWKVKIRKEPSGECFITLELLAKEGDLAWYLVGCRLFKNHA